MKKPCVIFTANRAYALSNSRKSIIQKFISNDWDVVIATANDDVCKKLCETGAIHEQVDFNRGGLSPKSDLKSYASLRKIIAKWNPVLIHNFHAKPVIMGSILGKKRGVSTAAVVNTITGLGHAFITGGLPEKIACLGYRLSVPKADCTIFQNRDDMKLFLQNGWCKQNQSKLIASSGVDITKYSKPVSMNSVDKKNLKIIMVGRLLNQKGICEFVEVANTIKDANPDTRFVLAGEEDPVHPDAIDMNWIHQQKNIDYVGQLEDITQLYKEADILLFPSYREGVPRVVLEAASMCIPTVAFDVPGVREAVIHGKTGYLVEHLNTGEMSNCIFKLITDQTLRIKLGEQARTLMEKQFDIKRITKQYISVYRELGIQV